MEKQKNINKSEVLGKILRIVGTGVLIPAIFLFPGSAIVINNFLNDKGIKQKHCNFRRLLIRAKKNKLLGIVQRGGDDFLEITRRGKKELLKYDIDELIIKKPRVWDGKWRVIIFDIPEKRGEGRRALSRKLKELGLYPLQKSTFVSPYECENEIDFIREFFDVEKFVILLKASTMGRYHDLILKNYFDLL